MKRGNFFPICTSLLKEQLLSGAIPLTYHNIVCNYKELLKPHLCYSANQIDVGDTMLLPPLFYHKLACDRREQSSVSVVFTPLKCTILAGTIPLFYHKLACDRRELISVYAALAPPKMHLLGGDNTFLLLQTRVQPEVAKLLFYTVSAPP